MMQRGVWRAGIPPDQARPGGYGRNWRAGARPIVALLEAPRSATAQRLTSLQTRHTMPSILDGAPGPIWLASKFRSHLRADSARALQRRDRMAGPPSSPHNPPDSAQGGREQRGIARSCLGRRILPRRDESWTLPAQPASRLMLPPPLSGERGQSQRPTDLSNRPRSRPTRDTFSFPRARRDPAPQNQDARQTRIKATHRNAKEAQSLPTTPPAARNQTGRPHGSRIRSFNQRRSNRPVKPVTRSGRCPALKARHTRQEIGPPRAYPWRGLPHANTNPKASVRHAQMSRS